MKNHQQSERPERMLYSIPDAAEALGGISPNHVRNLILDKTLNKVKIGRRVMVTVESIKRLLETGCPSPRAFQPIPKPQEIETDSATFYLETLKANGGPLPKAIEGACKYDTCLCKAKDGNFCGHHIRMFAGWDAASMPKLPIPKFHVENEDVPYAGRDAAWERLVKVTKEREAKAALIPATKLA